MNGPSDDFLLQVTGLKTYFYLRRGTVKAVNGVSFNLKRGEVLGLVGESGSGKSVTGLSILRLIPDPPGRIVGGRIFFNGEDIISKGEKEMRKLRGSHMTMIQQNPDSSLNPVFRVGRQIGEAISINQGLQGEVLWARVLEMLRLVHIAAPEIRAFDFPHQMSGGMRQRIAGAIALSCQAGLLIADEPTTNLDVTTQMEYLRLLKEIQSETDIAIIFITHDFGIVSKICHRVAVMYAGKIVEVGPTREVMSQPFHPYTAALLHSIPRPGTRMTSLHCIEGEPPDPVNLPPNCTFAPRCARAEERCFKGYPSEVKMNKNHYVSCFHAGP